MEIYEKRHDLKTKLRKRQKVFAAWTSLAHPSIAEIFTRSGITLLALILSIVRSAKSSHSVLLPPVREVKHYVYPG